MKTEITELDYDALEIIGQRIIKARPKLVDTFDAVMRAEQTVLELLHVSTLIVPLDIVALANAEFSLFFDEVFDISNNLDTDANKFLNGYAPKFVKGYQPPVDDRPEYIKSLSIHEQDAVTLIAKLILEHSPPRYARFEAAVKAAETVAMLLEISEQAKKLNFTKLYSMDLLPMLTEIAKIIISYDRKTKELGYAPICAWVAPQEVDLATAN